MDLGECAKVHDLALRADYEIASKESEFFFELDVSNLTAHAQFWISVPVESVIGYKVLEQCKLDSYLFFLFYWLLINGGLFAHLLFRCTEINILFSLNKTRTEIFSIQYFIYLRISTPG